MHQVAESASKVGKSGPRWAHFGHLSSLLTPAGPFLASLGALLLTFKEVFCVFVQYSQFVLQFA